MEAGVKQCVVVNILDEDEMLEGRHETCKACILAELYGSSQRHIRRITDEIQYRIDNLEARIADSIIEGVNVVKSGNTMLSYAK